MSTTTEVEQLLTDDQRRVSIKDRDAPPSKRRSPARVGSGEASEIETVVVARRIDTTTRKEYKLSHRIQLGNPTIAPVASVPGKLEAEADSFNAACRRVMAHALTEGRTAR